jgi:HEAT repeat protein
MDIKEENDWVKSQIERFFNNLSKPDTFNSIAAMLQKLDGRNTEQVNVLRQVLLYFSPETILLLGPVMLQNRSHVVQKMIQEVIEYLCLKDLNPLEQLLDHPDEAMGERLLVILERLQGERAQKIFYAMLDHPSDKVRTLAIRVLISKEPHNIKRLFPFIKDPYEPIQKEIFAWMDNQKSEQLENLLIGYMKKNLHHSDPDHILTCYKALGHCGSATSIPFLRRILLKNGWNSFTGFGKLTHRRGAGCALALLDTWEAKDILLEASNSKFPVVRQAFHESMAIINEPGDQSNE